MHHTRMAHAPAGSTQNAAGATPIGVVPAPILGATDQSKSRQADGATLTQRGTDGPQNMEVEESSQSSDDPIMHLTEARRLASEAVQEQRRAEAAAQRASSLRAHEECAATAARQQRLEAELKKKEEENAAIAAVQLRMNAEHNRREQERAAAFADSQRVDAELATLSLYQRQREAESAADIANQKRNECLAEMSKVQVHESLWKQDVQHDSLVVYTPSPLEVPMPADPEDEIRDMEEKQAAEDMRNEVVSYKQTLETIDSVSKELAEEGDDMFSGQIRMSLDGDAAKRTSTEAQATDKGMVNRLQRLQGVPAKATFEGQRRSKHRARS